jgi:hypothetical protein
MVPDTCIFPHETLPAAIISLSHVVATRPGVIAPLRWKVSGPPRVGNGAGHLFNFQEARAASNAGEKLVTHSLHLVQTSLPSSSPTSVGRCDVYLFYLLISLPSLSAYSFTWVDRCDVLLFCLLVSLPSLPAYSFTWVDRRDVLLFYLLISSPSLPAYPFSRLAGFHDVCGCTWMT